MKNNSTKNAVSTPAIKIETKNAETANSTVIEVKTSDSGRYTLKLNGKKVALKAFNLENGFYAVPRDTEIIFNGRKLRYIGQTCEYFDTEYVFADEDGNGARNDKFDSLLWNLAKFGTHDVSKLVTRIANEKQAYFVRTKIEVESKPVDDNAEVFNLLPDFTDADEDDDELIDEPAEIESAAAAAIVETKSPADKGYNINPDFDKIKFNHVNIYTDKSGQVRFDGIFQCKKVETAYRRFRKIMLQVNADHPELNLGGENDWLPAEKIELVPSTEHQGLFFGYNETGDLLFADSNEDSLALDINEDSFYFFGKFNAESPAVVTSEETADAETETATDTPAPHEETATGLNATVDSGAKAFELVAKYFPNGLKFGVFVKGDPGKDVFTFEGGKDRHLFVVCTLDNSRVELLVAVDANSNRKPLLVTIKPPEINEVDADEYAISEDAFNFAVEYEIEEAEIAALEARSRARILANETLKIRYDKAKTQVKYERYENGYCGWYFKGKNRDNWECNVTKATACLTRYGLSRFEFIIFSENEPAVIADEIDGYDENQAEIAADPWFNRNGESREDEFAEKMAALTDELKEANAACTEACKRREIKRKEYNAACEAVEDAEILVDRKREAIAKFGRACAKDLSEKLFDDVLIFSPTMKVINQEGNTCETNFEQIQVFFHDTNLDFYVTTDWIHLGEYDTPAQVETVISELKAAIERGDSEFKFPTVDELTGTEKFKLTA